jgi:hypothetical protein
MLLVAHVQIGAQLQESHAQLRTKQITPPITIHQTTIHQTKIHQTGTCLVTVPTPTTTEETTLTAVAVAKDAAAGPIIEDNAIVTAVVTLVTEMTETAGEI